MRRTTSLLAVFLIAAACGDSEAPADPPQLLFTQHASGAVLTETTLTLTGVSSQTHWFTDRPYRQAGQIPTENFIGIWGAGEDSFADDPPNALFTCTAGGEVVNYVLELFSPRLEGVDLAYDVILIPPGDEGASTAAPSTACSTEANLFIDSFPQCSSTIEDCLCVLCNSGISTDLSPEEKQTCGC